MRGTRWEYGQEVHLLLQILAKLFNRSSFADAKPNLASNVCGPDKDMGKAGKNMGKTRIRARQARIWAVQARIWARQMGRNGLQDCKNGQRIGHGGFQWRHTWDKNGLHR